MVTQRRRLTLASAGKQRTSFRKLAMMLFQAVDVF